MNDNIDMNKKELPLISIIIPIYKVEKYLRFCLDSVICQTYKNLQIILINDGSPDNCEEICLEYCKKDRRFEYHKKQNEGLGETRNYGICNCIKGEFVSFIDSDDAIHPQQVEILYSLLKENPSCSFSKAMYYRFTLESNIKNILYEKYDYSVFLIEDAIKKMIDTGSSDEITSIQASWNKLYRANDIKECRYHKESPAEDIYFNAQYYPKITHFAETKLPLYFYRRNPTSITAKLTYKHPLINAERFADVYRLLPIKFRNLKDDVSQCIIRKYLSIKYLETSETPIALTERRKKIGKEFMPIYLKSNDSLKMKTILSIFYYIPFTYKWFREFMERKAKHI